MKYDYNELKLNPADIKKENRSEEWWTLIVKNKTADYTFWRFNFTTGIADWIEEKMKKRGDKIPAKHWEWRHVEDTKTLKEAKLLFNKAI